MNGKENPIKPKRPAALWVLSICTLIDAGMDIIGYFNFVCFPNMIQKSIEFVKEMPAFNNEEVSKVFDAYLTVPNWKFILLIIASVAIFVGALIMIWKLKQIGFHIYAIGQIFYSAILYFLLGKPFITGISELLWTAILIVLFATQLKYMIPVKQNESNMDDNEINTNESTDETPIE